MLGGKFVVDEAAHRQALGQDLAHGGGQPVGAVAFSHAVGLRDQAGDRDARKLVEQRQHRLPDRPADVLEVDIDAVRAGRRQLGGEIGVPVIDGGVEAKLVLHIRAFLGAARDADCPCAGDLRELADQRPDRSTRRRDDHRFSGLRFTDHAQAAVCSEPGHPEHAKASCHWRHCRIELAQVRAIRQRVRAPSRLGKHDIAFGIAGMLRDDHLCNGFTLHDTTERNRCRIRFPVIHPAAHIRIER